MGYFDNYKKENFPDIKDWSDPQDKLRNTPGYKQSLADWFWFNPFAYRYIMVMNPATFFVSGIILLLLGIIYEFKILYLISIIICLISGIKLYKAVSNYTTWEQNKTNMYDQHLREYPAGGLK